PSPASNVNFCPSAWGMTRISENRIAASKPNRRTGCNVTSPASTGLKHRSRNDPAFARTSRYSGRYRPACRMSQIGTCAALLLASTSSRPGYACTRVISDCILLNRIFKTCLTFLIGGGLDSRIDLRVLSAGCPHRLWRLKRRQASRVMKTISWNCNGLLEPTRARFGLRAYLSTPQEQAGFRRRGAVAMWKQEQCRAAPSLAVGFKTCLCPSSSTEVQ